jgi:uncharacterized membrane protein YedE/YeeE
VIWRINPVEFLSRPWPWYVSGPIIGLIVPLLLLVGNRQFGLSSNFRHICAAMAPRRAPWLQYDWKSSGLWNLAFLVGVMLGGYLGGRLFAAPGVHLAEATRADLARLGVPDMAGLYPASLFNWSSLLSIRGVIFIVLGGFLVGFGASYAGGCTSGHGVMGLAALQKPSILAVIAFFIGGMTMTWLIYPLLLGGGGR